MSSMRLNDPVASVGTVQGSIPMIVQDVGTVGFYPGVLPTTTSVEDQGLLADEYGAAYTRAGITTDEASVRLNFSGVSLTRALPGTPTWTNGCGDDNTHWFYISNSTKRYGRNGIKREIGGGIKFGHV